MSQTLPIMEGALNGLKQVKSMQLESEFTNRDNVMSLQDPQLMSSLVQWRWKVGPYRLPYLHLGTLQQVTEL